MASAFLEAMGEAWLACLLVRVFVVALIVGATVAFAWVAGGRA